jgi:membrane protein DedA with SNARE-associated domain
LFAAGALGAFLGDLYFYRAGATEESDFSEVWYLRDEGRGLPEVRTLVRETGPLSVITSKVFGSRRALVPIAAGVEAMPLAEFAAASAVAAVLCSAVLLAPGLALRAFYS